jgi:pimeloyl-ACP methyl ester carboxylesterase
VNLQDPATDKAWDERNNVEVRRIASASEIDHKATEPYEFIVPAPSGGPLDIVALYAPKESRTLIVSFHGSLQRSKFQLPRFEWRRSLEPFEAAQLFIADSTLHLNRAMALAWYIGNSEQDFSSDVADLIRDIATAAGYDRILLTGSSGGGFAALAVSRQIDGSAAVCFSPQTRVGDYRNSVVRAFYRTAFPDMGGYAAVERAYRSRFNLRHLYATTPDINFVRFVQNTRDPEHFSKHYTPFAEERGVVPSLGGFDESGRIEFVPQEQQEGHKPPSRGRFRANLLEAHARFFGAELVVLEDEDEKPRLPVPSKLHRRRLLKFLTRNNH